jgi:isoamylase
MLLSGDELGRTQQGNNNAYCQDNELTFLDWQNKDEALLAFTRRLVSLRRRHPVLRRRHFFQGRPLHGSNVSDIAWFKPSGEVMAEEDWSVSFARSLGVFLNGDEIPSPGPRGERVTDDSLLLLFNAHAGPVDFVTPGHPWGLRWRLIVDTADLDAEPGTRSIFAGETTTVSSRSVVVFRRAE